MPGIVEKLIGHAKSAGERQKGRPGRADDPVSRAVGKEWFEVWNCDWAARGSCAGAGKLRGCAVGLSWRHKVEISFVNVEKLCVPWQIGGKDDAWR